MEMRVGKESADVANFAMMIADVCGGLPVVTVASEGYALVPRVVAQELQMYIDAEAGEALTNGNRLRRMKLDRLTVPLAKPSRRTVNPDEQPGQAL